MKLAHNPKARPNLATKVAAGSASDDEKKELVELYTDLTKNTPKKGSPDSWKEKSTAALEAAKDVQAGKAGAGAALKQAIKCAGCHNAHK
jgi:hypothetical protein